MGLPASGAAFGRLTARLGPAKVAIDNAAPDGRHDWREMTPEFRDERMAGNLRRMFFAI